MQPAAQISRQRHGEEALPVVIADDFFAEPAIWVERACARQFAPIGPYYPGIRASLSAEETVECVSGLSAELALAFGGRSFRAVESYFSLVTTAPADLQPIQRLPHFDNFSEKRIALLIYLNGRPDSGTAFYRQRETGFESVTEERYARFAKALEDGVKEHGMPPPAYIGGDTPIYQQIARYDGRPNRGILYRSNSLHCAEIPPDLPLLSEPASGRLTINIFLEAR